MIHLNPWPNDAGSSVKFKCWRPTQTTCTASQTERPTTCRSPSFLGEEWKSPGNRPFRVYGRNAKEHANYCEISGKEASLVWNPFLHVIETARIFLDQIAVVESSVCFL